MPELFSQVLDLKEKDVFLETEVNDSRYFSVVGLPSRLSYGKHPFALTFNDPETGPLLKNLSNIIFSQKKATENVFKKKKIPFRSFEIYKRNEKTLGELFCFFMLETILIGKCLKIDPFDQPAVELIKQETKKLLI